MDEKPKNNKKEVSVYDWNEFKTGMRLILPPNFQSLDFEDKIKVEEVIYRLQIIHNHGFLIGEYDEISRADK